MLANKGLISGRKPLRMKGVVQRSGNLARQPCVGSFCNSARSSVREQARSYGDAAGGGSMAASIDHPPFQREQPLRTLLDEQDDQREDEDLAQHGADLRFENLVGDAKAEGGEDAAG